jgi:hypothetical protein
MTEYHLLHLDAIKSIEAISQFRAVGTITDHFQDNQTGTGTKIIRHFMKPNPGFDAATVTSQKLLDFRCILDPVLNVNPQNDMFSILHHLSPFTYEIAHQRKV